MRDNPHGWGTLIRLSRLCQGAQQAQAFAMMCMLAQLDDGMNQLIRHRILKVLMTPEFLFRPTTLVSVRHEASKLIKEAALIAPHRFPVDAFAQLAYDEKTGTRRIDGTMEMHLLTGFLAHLSWREKSNKGPLPRVFVLFKYFINEVMAEEFESLEHMQQIMRACIMVSGDPKHISFLMDNYLQQMLQYIVRTDFSLFQKAHKKTVDSESSERAKLKAIAERCKTKRKSILDDGERPKATLMFLSLVKPEKQFVVRNNDINFITTRYVTILFENIIEYRMDVISAIVASGLIPALLFRVGKGTDRDVRFNKLVIHLLYHMLSKVMLYQSHGGNHLSLATGPIHKLAHFIARGPTSVLQNWPSPTIAALSPLKTHAPLAAIVRLSSPPKSLPSSPSISSRPKTSELPQSPNTPTTAAAAAATTTTATALFHHEGDDESSIVSAVSLDNVAEMHLRKAIAASSDIRSISNTMCAQGVVEVCFATLAAPVTEDERSTVKEAISIIAMMNYSVLHNIARQEANLQTLFNIYRARPDCFFPFLNIICDMFQYQDTKEETLDLLIKQLGALKVLMRALKLSGWTFQAKDKVFRCFAPLTELPYFYNSLKDSDLDAISIVMREVEIRKKAPGGRAAKRAMDDDGTERLASLLKKDIAATRIACMARRRSCKRRIWRLLGRAFPDPQGKKVKTRKNKFRFPT